MGALSRGNGGRKERRPLRLHAEACSANADEFWISSDAIAPGYQSILLLHYLKHPLLPVYC